MAEDLHRRSATVPPDDQTPGRWDGEQQTEGHTPGSDHDDRISGGDGQHRDHVDDECDGNPAKDTHVIDSTVRDLRHLNAEAAQERDSWPYDHLELHGETTETRTHANPEVAERMTTCRPPPPTGWA